jgi:Na+-transporting methylmalonyl-CoA/oxaloacetate decarboxylase gamma subunit
MDETSGASLPEPVVVLRTPSPATSSLSWALVPTMVVLLVLGLLDLLVLAVRVVGAGASAFLAPIAGGSEPLPAPDAGTHLVAFVVAATLALVAAVAVSTAWDRVERRTTARRGPAAWPRAARGLLSAAVASSLAAAVLLSWIDLTLGDLVALVIG